MAGILRTLAWKFIRNEVVILPSDQRIRILREPKPILPTQVDGKP